MPALAHLRSTACTACHAWTNRGGCGGVGFAAPLPRVVGVVAFIPGPHVAPLVVRLRLLVRREGPRQRLRCSRAPRLPRLPPTPVQLPTLAPRSADRCVLPGSNLARSTRARWSRQRQAVRPRRAPTSLPSLLLQCVSRSVPQHAPRSGRPVHQERRRARAGSQRTPGIKGSLDNRRLDTQRRRKPRDGIGPCGPQTAHHEADRVSINTRRERERTKRRKVGRDGQGEQGAMSRGHARHDGRDARR